MTLEQLEPLVTRKYQTAQHILEDILVGMRNSRTIKQTTLAVLHDVCLRASNLELKRVTLLGKLKKFEYIDVDGEIVRIKTKR